MKVCTKCNVNKKRTEFFKKKDRPLGISSHCKLCTYEYRNKRRKQNPQKSRDYHNSWRHNQKDGKWSVYMLINAKEYVGYTNNEWRRMAEHRALGYDTTDYRVLMKCDTVEEAKELEELLHDMGYPGKYGHKKSPTKR